MHNKYISFPKPLWETYFQWIKHIKAKRFRKVETGEKENKQNWVPAQWLQKNIISFWSLFKGQTAVVKTRLAQKRSLNTGKIHCTERHKALQHTSWGKSCGLNMKKQVFVWGWCFYSSSGTTYCVIYLVYILSHSSVFKNPIKTHPTKFWCSFPENNYIHLQLFSWYVSSLKVCTWLKLPSSKSRHRENSTAKKS